MEPETTTDRKAIYQFTKGLDKKLRDVMVFSYDAMVKDYNKLLKINYRSIASKNLPLNSIKLLISISIFYRVILKPLYGGRDFVDRLNSKFNLGIRIGKKGQRNINVDEIAEMERSFFAISKSFGVKPNFFDFQEVTDLIKKLTVIQNENSEQQQT